MLFRDSESNGPWLDRELHPHTLVHNAFVRDVDELQFNEAWLEFQGLFEFLWHEGRAEQGLDADGDDLYKVVQVPEARLTFHLSWDRRCGSHEKDWKRRARLQIELASPASYTHWIETWVRPLRNLLILATREPSRLESFRAVTYDEDLDLRFFRIRDEKAFRRRDVEFVTPESDLVRSEPRYRYRRMLFGLAEVGSRADDLLARWFKMHQQLAGSRDFFFAALASRMYVENLLLNLMSAAEAYHRTFHDSQPLTDERHQTLRDDMLALTSNTCERRIYDGPLTYANSQSQRDRLRGLIDNASGAIAQLAPLRRDLVKQLVATRNYFTHLDGHTSDVREGLPLAALLDQLVMVLQANFLLDLGLPSADVEQVIRRSYERQPEVFLQPE